MEFIDLKAQYRHLKQEIDNRIHRVLDHGKYILGPEVAELEAALATRVGTKHCITCASGTDALLIAMLAVGVGPGDEVLTSPFTFFATGEMVTLLGATPTFIDIDPVTYNMDPALLEAAISPGTRAILPVSLYGHPAEFDTINAIANRYGIPVIEDAAQSFGASYKGRQSGGLSTIGCTSFFPSKPLGAYGDGGACFTNDDALAAAMRELRNHGQPSRYHHTRIGVNGRLDTIQAAILLAKLAAFDDELKGRQNAAARYEALLADAVETPRVLPGCTSPYAQYTIAVDERDRVQKEIAKAGVPTSVHYPVPLHLQPVYAGLGLGRGSYPRAEQASERVLSLPMHPYLSEEQTRRVADAVLAAVAVHS